MPNQTTKNGNTHFQNSKESQIDDRLLLAIVPLGRFLGPFCLSSIPLFLRPFRNVFHFRGRRAGRASGVLSSLSSPR